MLVAFKPDGTRVDFRVRGGRCVIGRDTDTDLRIPVGTVSRQHCEVRVDDDEPVVRDLGSSNGTFLNGKRVTESPIDAGDLLRVGPTTFTVVVDGIPDVVTPPSEEPDEPEGSSMMDMPGRAAGAAAGAGLGVGAGSLTDGEDSDDDDLITAAPARKRDADDADSDPDDPFSKMVERQDDDDDDDFDFDFFDEDEDEDD
ncbi:MAG: FHA domain-containing protein [Phycisphaerales bacterium]